MIGFNIYFCIKQGKSALLATLKQNRSFEHEYHESIWHMDLFFIRTRIFLYTHKNLGFCLRHFEHEIFLNTNNTNILNTRFTVGPLTEGVNTNFLRWGLKPKSVIRPFYVL